MQEVNEPGRALPRPAPIRFHQHGLCTFLRFLSLAMFIGFGAGFALAAATLAHWDRSLLLGAAISVVVAAILWLAARSFHAQRDREGTILLLAGVIGTALTYVVVSPGGAAFIALLPIITMALLLPSFRKRRLFGLLAVVGITTAAILAMNLLWNPATRLPAWLDLSFRIAGYLGLLALTIGFLYRNQRVSEERAERALAEREALERAHAGLEGSFRALEESRARLEESNISLHETQRRLERGNRAITRFLNDAAHELRTPLMPVLMHMELMRESPTIKRDPAMQRSLEIVERNLTRLKDTLNELVEVAQLHAEQATFRTKDTPLKDIMQELNETFEGVAGAKEVRLKVDSPEIRLKADPDKIFQVLSNLVVNALESTDAGGSIWVHASTAGDLCLIHVTDTGRGLQPQELEKVFEPFAPSHGEMQTRGVGLSLYISRKIVEGHGGWIECTSKGPGLGTTYRFAIPLARDAKSPAARREAKHPSTNPPRDPP